MPEKWSSATEKKQTAAEEQKASRAGHSKALVGERIGATTFRCGVKVKIRIRN
jgi:hypothetical protein